MATAPSTGDTRRRRKWDAPPTGTSSTALAAATAAAANLSARVQPNIPGGTDSSGTGWVREFEINDNPGRRFAMMSSNLKMVETQTGVVIVSKGRYYGPGESVLGGGEEGGDKNRKLFLKIKGADEGCVEEAVKMLEGIMRRGGSGGGGKRERDMERVWCDMDAGLAPELEVVKRLKGPRGEYVKWIHDESGASVMLAGRGSGSGGGDSGRENLHFVIRGGTGQTGMARGLCYSLVRCVQAVYNEHMNKWYGGRGIVRRGARWGGGARGFDRRGGDVGGGVEMGSMTPASAPPPPPPPAASEAGCASSMGTGSGTGAGGVVAVEEAVGPVEHKAGEGGL